MTVLAQKQLYKAMLKKKAYVFLMLLLGVLTSFMYFFVRFSVDGNYGNLKRMQTLDDHYQKYMTGLISNAKLADSFLYGLMILTAFVCGMFFYRFFKDEKKQFGCLKNMGMTDQKLSFLLVKAVFAFSLICAAGGMAAGYFASGILVRANEKTYLIKNAVRGIRIQSAFMGILAPAVLFCVITYLVYGIIRGKDTAVLIADTAGRIEFSPILCMADKIAGIFPKKQRLSVRLALRNLVALAFLGLSIMVITMMFHMAYSLNKSSEYLYQSQSEGRDYRYETVFDNMQDGLSDAERAQDMVCYTSAPCEVGVHQNQTDDVHQNVMGMSGETKLFRLQDGKGNRISFPQMDEVVISEFLSEVYGVKKGGLLSVKMSNITVELRVKAIAYNAEKGYIYMQKEQLNRLLGYGENAYNGVYSNTELDHVHAKDTKRTVISKEDRTDALKRETVSNRLSAVINQIIGCVSGCIFLCLALLLNLQSNRKNMHILKMIGYEKREIRKIYIDIYRPLIIVGYLVLLLPAMWITRCMMRMLSMQIGDFLIFQSSFGLILGVFLIIWVLYYMNRFIYTLK